MRRLEELFKKCDGASVSLGHRQSHSILSTVGFAAEDCPSLCQAEFEYLFGNLLHFPSSAES